MKKKLAIAMAAMMTVAMVPATAFASTKLTAVDEVTTGTDDIFVSRVELSNDNEQTKVDKEDAYIFDEKGEGTDDDVYGFDVNLKLTNGVFAENEDTDYRYDNDDYDDKYVMDKDNDLEVYTDADDETANTPIQSLYYDVTKSSEYNGILEIDVTGDTTAVVTLDADVFNQDDGNKACVLPIVAKADETGDVVAKFDSNVSSFKTVSEVIANAVDGDADIAIDGVKTFVEDGDDSKNLEDITIDELTPGTFSDNGIIKLKLKGNYKFVKANFAYYVNDSDAIVENTKDYNDESVDKDVASADLLNETTTVKLAYVDSDTVELNVADFDEDMLSKITISNIELKTDDCDPGDVATITVSSEKNSYVDPVVKGDDFDSVKLEVAKMVEEAVTYSVEDDDVPTIWAGKNYADEDDTNTLELSIEENTGDILNTSRKATFTFPEGIEVCDIDTDGVREAEFEYKIDDNVVTIYNYQKKAGEGEKVDMSIKFALNAAPTFSGDVDVTLGGQFDDTTFKVATVKAPYTVEAKTSEVLIDYRYVPVNDIVITEAEDGILDDDDKIVLAVEKMDFEDAGDAEVTEGDIDVDVDIDDDLSDIDLFKSEDAAYLVVTVNDASTEASTIVISGLELYLDRTLPVGGYALQNVGGKFDSGDKDAINVLWENSSDDDDVYDVDYDSTNVSDDLEDLGIFKYKELTANDEYVDVITAARDQDDSMTTKKIVITVGAATMAAGTETVTLDAPAYINADNYTMLPLRAISEAFGATVNWDDTTKTVTILSGQRIISMTIGSRTMYINGTPVAMNTAPEITSGRTFVPVRDLSNSLGISDINWTEASGTVTLN